MLINPRLFTFLYDKIQSICSGLCLQSEISLDDIITSFGKDIKYVKLGFTPKNKQDFDVKLVKKIDTNMLVKGEGFNDFSKKKCMIPILSHA